MLSSMEDTRLLLPRRAIHIFAHDVVASDAFRLQEASSTGLASFALDAFIHRLFLCYYLLCAKVRHILEYQRCPASCLRQDSSFSAFSAHGRDRLSLIYFGLLARIFCRWRLASRRPASTTSDDISCTRRTNAAHARFSRRVFSRPHFEYFSCSPMTPSMVITMTYRAFVVAPETCRREAEPAEALSRTRHAPFQIHGSQAFFSPAIFLRACASKSPSHHCIPPHPLTCKSTRISASSRKALCR